MSVASSEACILTSSECEKQLTGHQMVGLAAIVEAAYLSIAAITFILLLILYNLRRHNYHLHAIFQTPIDIYIFSLIISDLFHDLGSVLSIRWIQLGRVYCGKLCTTQGTVQTLGTTSSAMFTLVIAIYTFWVIAFRRPPISKGLWVPLFIVTLIWSYVVIFIVIVASERGNWDIPAPYWCWIGHRHLAAQLAGEYLWLWIAGCASIVLYVPLFFILKGWNGCRRDGGQERIGSNKQVKETAYCGTNLGEKIKRGHEERLEQAHVHHTDIPVIMVRKDGASHTTIPTMDSRFASSLHRASPSSHPLSDVENAPETLDPSSVPIGFPIPRLKSDPQHSYSPSVDEESPKSDSNVSIPTRFYLGLLLYPIAYTVIVLPLSIARWSSRFSATPNQTEERMTLTGMAIYNLSGFINALLVLFIRRNVSLLSPPRKEDNDEENMMDIGTRVDGTSALFSRALAEEDEKRDPVANNNYDEPSSIHSHMQTQIRPRLSTSKDERRKGSTAAAPASETAVGSTSSRRDDEHRNRPRRKKPQKIADDEDRIDTRVRTVEVRGEVDLPD